MDLKTAFEKLNEESVVSFHSTPRLVDQVRGRAKHLDRERVKKKRPPLARPGRTFPFPGAQNAASGMSVTPWQLLHTFARAVALAGQGSARALAQQWDCLRYVTAIETRDGRRMRLSSEGENWHTHKRSLQARDLGSAFGLSAAQQLLRERYPDHRFDVLDAEIVFSAFRPAKGRRPAAGNSGLPNHFLVGRKPGAPLRIFAVDARGSHGKPEAQHDQLARSQHRAHTLLLGESDTRGEPVPALMLATSLLKGEGIETRVLATDGLGILTVPGKSAPNLSEPAADKNLYPEIDTRDADGLPSSRPGFAIHEDHWEWLSQILARTGAASLLTFAGERDTARGLLTERQQKLLGPTGSDSTPGLQCDASITLGGMTFVGTDQVFRLRKQRVEVFSALLSEQRDLLANWRLDEHEARLPTVLKAWHRNKSVVEHQWGGLVHMDSSGALLAIRKQRRSNRRLL
ncbi:hypothetical protein GCM10027271_31850 [Saccharopolyspora gloriosae]|uniref:Uncharacterized protein n=1 Tax=Saccharopolyspora gloriosae TaxID=455344 RepID=A0A840NI07_9PSEU|nr:hypothetical protein [Saccharopolyspora gloriosae]MBB5069918.1 hypothetical protein [Saccharopolyspora gloriosae]